VVLITRKKEVRVQNISVTAQQPLVQRQICRADEYGAVSRCVNKHLSMMEFHSDTDYDVKWSQIKLDIPTEKRNY
jgi:hypothetical protein